MFFVKGLGSQIGQTQLVLPSAGLAVHSLLGPKENNVLEGWKVYESQQHCDWCSPSHLPVRGKGEPRLGRCRERDPGSHLSVTWFCG